MDMKRIKKQDLLIKRKMLVRIGYEQMLLSMEELAQIFSTTKQNISRILSERSTQGE
jgi:hypothetical protein